MALLNWLAYGNVIIALSAGMVTYGFAQSTHIQNAWIMGIAVFFATVFVYGLHRLLRLPDLSDTDNPRHLWILKNKSGIRLVSVLSGIAAAIIYTQWLMEIGTLLVLSVIGVISILYAWRVGDSAPLREWPYLKIILIAGSWTVVCFLWPLIAGHQLAINQLVLLISPFLYFTAIIIPFDVRDLKYDLPNQKTIPQLIGAKKSIYLSLSLLLAAYTIGLFFDDLFASPLMILAFAAQFIFILFSFQPQPEYFYAFGIDGAIILYGWAYLL
jgi:hypothetical protein